MCVAKDRWLSSNRCRGKQTSRSVVYVRISCLIVHCSAAARHNPGSDTPSDICQNHLPSQSEADLNAIYFVVAENDRPRQVDGIQTAQTAAKIPNTFHLPCSAQYNLECIARIVDRKCCESEGTFPHRPSIRTSNSANAQFPPGYAEEYSGDIALRTAIAFIVLEFTFVTLRYISRALGKLPAGPDDYLMIPARVICLGVDASSIGEERS